MSDNSSDSFRSQPKKTVDESDLNPNQPKETVIETNPSLSPRTPFVRKDPLEGKTIGDRSRYRLQILLGEGGMSKVYQALDTKFEDRVVAIKLMTHYSAVGDKNLIKRFMGEVKAISRLKHPNIIQIFDFGVTSNEAPFYGLPFYVMEYFAGKTLQKLLNENKIVPPDSLLKIISQVCAGLKEAHQKGIVHRDLKPDNIFLVAGGAFGEIIKILDFGIAKNISPDAHNQTQLTQEGTFIGTYRYASPEQCRGLANMDRRSDIYSLGIILYEAICGNNPYNLDDDSITSQADWIACHIRVTPKPLKQQPGCENIEDEIESMVMKCLAKSPQDRFLNIDQLQNAIANILSVKIETDYDVKTNPRISNELEENSFHFETEVEVEQTINKTVVETRGNNFSKNLASKPNNKVAPTTLSVAPHQHQKIRSRRKVLQYGCLALVGMSLTALLTKKLKQIPPKPSKPSLEFEIEPVKNIQIVSSEEVWSLAISPDGEYIVSGNNNGTLEFFNRKTGELQKTLKEHQNVIRSLAFVPKNNQLISGDGDGNIKVWNQQNNNLEKQLQAHSASIWDLAVSPDGQTLVSSSEDKSIIIWSLTTGETNSIIFSHDTVVYALAFGFDGKVFASGGKDNIVKIWNAKDRTLLKSLSGHQDAIRAMVTSPDGKFLVSGSWDKTVKVWELKSGQLITTFKGHQDRVVTVAVSQDSQTVFSGSTDNTIKVWSINNSKLITTLSQHYNWVLALATSQQENLLVSGGKDSTIKLWQYKSTNLI